MYQFLFRLGCCYCLLLMVTATSTELPEEFATTDDSYGFPEEDLTLQELGTPSSQEEQLMIAQKINWLPIALGADADKELVRQVREVPEEEQAAEEEEEEELNLDQSVVPRDGNACPSNGERGLTQLIRNARPLIDAERMRNILANAREDAEVRNLFKLLKSDEFKERVMRLRNSKEAGVLRDYLCQALKLNHAYYIEYVKLLIDVQKMEPVSSPLPNRRKGVRGLLQDLRDALPRAQLRDLYRRQLALDKELSMAVRRIRSTEFRRLLGNVRALHEYRAVRDELQKAGVPMQQLLNLVSNALGWGSLDMGSEIEILSV